MVFILPDPLQLMRQDLPQHLKTIVPLFVFNTAGSPGNLLFFMVLMSAKSSVHTIKALSLMYLVLVGNVALVSTGSMIFTLGKFFFLLLCCGRLIYSLRRQGISPLRHKMMLPLIVFTSVSLPLAIQGGGRTMPERPERSRAAPRQSRRTR